MKGEEGVWEPPRSQRYEKKSNKMEASLFDESDFFLLRPVYFFLFSFDVAMLFILSQIKKHVFF